MSLPRGTTHQIVRAVADGTGLTEEGVWWAAATTAVVATAYTISRTVDLVLDLSDDMFK
jgi:hypothetical protein